LDRLEKKAQTRGEIEKGRLPRLLGRPKGLGAQLHSKMMRFLREERESSAKKKKERE